MRGDFEAGTSEGDPVSKYKADSQEGLNEPDIINFEFGQTSECPTYLKSLCANQRVSTLTLSCSELYFVLNEDCISAPGSWKGGCLKHLVGR